MSENAPEKIQSENPPWDFVVPEEREHLRIDVFLSALLREKFSRAKIQKFIEEGLVEVDGHPISSHYPLRAGQTIHFMGRQEPPAESAPEDIPVNILWEDDDVVVVHKPAGMVVHPAHGNLNHTLVNALLYHLKSLSHEGDEIRPGIVHRLDKDTSGVMLVAKNDRAHDMLARQFKRHQIEKVYLAVVKGVVQHDEGMCEEPVGRAFLNRKKIIIKPSGGRDALTYYKVVERYANATLVEVRPKTGRTHQIRVHMGFLGHPVFGDVLYGVNSPWISRHALHASSITFQHPKDGRRLSFEAPVPDDMKTLIDRLKSEKKKG